MSTFSNKNMPVLVPKYNCEYCQYNTSKKSSYDNHQLSSKHTNRIKGNVLETHWKQNMPKLCDLKNLSCENCNKAFKNRSGLWKHNKKCSTNKNCAPIDEKNNDLSDKDKLIIMLIKENSDFKSIIMEQQNMMMKVIENNNINHINNSNNTTNSNNKSFNLNFFLNETCKDAMNISEFIDSIKLQLSDLENVGELGYVQGISNIITTNLKALDVEKRPIHCTDKKRETLYIKDQNKWEKEDDNKNKLRKAIRKIANKNVTLIQDFKKKHPDCIKSTSRHSDKYNKIIVEAMGGSGNNDEEKEDKIIKNIAKEVTISSKNN